MVLKAGLVFMWLVTVQGQAGDMQEQVSLKIHARHLSLYECDLPWPA